MRPLLFLYTAPWIGAIINVRDRFPCPEPIPWQGYAVWNHRFSSSALWSMVSVMVIILLFIWKPRWVTIRRANSRA